VLETQVAAEGPAVRVKQASAHLSWLETR